MLVAEKETKVENNNKNYVNLYHLIKSNVMPTANTMFSKFKSGNQTPQNPIETNPITQYFEISKSVACAGPELVWKIYDAYRKSDGKVSYHKKILFAYVGLTLTALNAALQ